MGRNYPWATKKVLLYEHSLSEWLDYWNAIPNANRNKANVITRRKGDPVEQLQKSMGDRLDKSVGKDGKVIYKPKR